MARTETEQLVVSLEARIRQFERNFAKANRTAGRNFRQIESRAQTSARRLELSLGRASQRVNQQFTMMGRSMMGALGLGLGVAGLTRMTRDVLNAASSIQEAADVTSLSVEQFQALGYAAEMSGLRVDQFRQAIERMNRRAGDGVIQWQGSTLATLEAIADAVANAETAAERASIAYEAFGQSGLKMLPFLQQGSQGIRQLAQEAQNLGLVIDGQTIRAADELSNELDRLIAVAKANITAGALRGLVGDSGDLAEIYKDPQFMQGLQNLTRFTFEVIGFLIRNSDTVIRTFAAATSTLTAMRLLKSAPVPPLLRALLALTAGTAGWFSPEMKELLDWVRGVDESSGSMNSELEDTPVLLDNIVVSASNLNETFNSLSESQPDLFAPLEQATRDARFELALLQSDLDETGRNIARQLHGFGLVDSVSDLQGPQPRAVEDYIQAQRELNQEQERHLQLQEDQARAAAIWESTRTAAEQYRATLAEINRLEREGHLDHQTAGRARQQAWEGMTEEGQMARQMMDTFAHASTDAFTSVITGARSGREAMAALVQQLAEAIIRALILRAVSSAMGMPMGFSEGGAFGPSGQVQQFAKGGAFTNKVVNRPTAFRYGSDKLGVMGEKGPEAVMPLKRMPNGKLGVEGTVSGGSKVFAPSISINIEKPEVRNEGDSHQLAKDIARAVDITLEGKMAQFLRQQMRPGNMLNP